MNQQLVPQDQMINALSSIANVASVSSNQMAEISKMMIVMLQCQSELQKSVEEAKKQSDVAMQRIDNMNCVNLEGTPSQILNAYIRKYALEKGVQFNVAWNEFVQFYNTAYHRNLKLSKSNYCERYGLKKITTPEYLERVDEIQDGIRIADKMLNELLKNKIG